MCRASVFYVSNHIPAWFCANYQEEVSVRQLEGFAVSTTRIPRVVGTFLEGGRSRTEVTLGRYSKDLLCAGPLPWPSYTPSIVFPEASHSSQNPVFPPSGLRAQGCGVAPLWSFALLSGGPRRETCVSWASGSSHSLSLGKWPF